LFCQTSRLWLSLREYFHTALRLKL
jgi:hypothetical protein